MNDPHRILLKRAAFESEEIERVLPDWKHTARALCLSDEDVHFAVDRWLPKHWDLDLLGVRMMLGVLLRELIGVCLYRRDTDRNETLIYTALPFPAAIPLAVRMAARGPVRITASDVLLTVVMGAVFHKPVPSLDQGEDLFSMGKGCRNCILNKTRSAANFKGFLPEPDVTWVAGLLCDEGPKTQELIDCLGGPCGSSIICRLPHDFHAAGDVNQLQQRSAFLTKQVKYNFAELKLITGVDVKQEQLADASNRWRKYAYKYALLASITAHTDPPPIGSFETALFSLPLVLPFNEGLDAAEAALDNVLAKARQRRKKGKGTVARGTPRLLMYQMPYAQPWFHRLFKDAGSVLVGSLASMMMPSDSQPPDEENPLQRICDDWARNPGVCGMASEVEAVCRLVQHYRPDGLIMGLFDFDRWLGAHQRMIANAVQEKIDGPIFYLEGDLWDQGEYTRENLRTRIETICQMVNAEKQMDAIV